MAIAGLKAPPLRLPNVLSADRTLNPAAIPKKELFAEALVVVVCSMTKQSTATPMTSAANDVALSTAAVYLQPAAFAQSVALLGTFS